MSQSIQGPDHRPIPTSRYDLLTYLGRVRHCLEISDPRNLAVSQADVQLAKKMLHEYRHGHLKEFTDDLWHHKRVLDLTVHPETGETIFLPFRMSSCVLSNLVVTAGMLTPGLGTAGTVLWQWANQSLNVAINISNANKSNPLSNSQLMVNYGAAVSASCGVALGLNALVPRLKRVSPKTKLVMLRLIPFAAVVAAGIVNVFLMRSQELKKGITVSDAETKEELGTSKVAAVYAVGETAASRVINAAPIMAIPPLILVKLQKGFLRGKGLGVTTAVNLGLITVTSFAVLPFALAIFPQTERLHVSKLEAKFSDMTTKKGTKVEYVEFNRGI